MAFTLAPPGCRPASDCSAKLCHQAGRLSRSQGCRCNIQKAGRGHEPSPGLAMQTWQCLGLSRKPRWAPSVLGRQAVDSRAAHARYTCRQAARWQLQTTASAEHSFASDEASRMIESAVAADWRGCRLADDRGLTRTEQPPGGREAGQTSWCIHLQCQAGWQTTQSTSSMR